MKDNFKKVSRKRKKKIEKRLENNNYLRSVPMITASNIQFELAEKTSAIHCGGIGLVHEVVNAIGLPKLINENLELFKVHKPYFESDHILNMTYNIINGGDCLEDIELLRNNIAYLDCLGADRIPDPTTAGDFLRRFNSEDKMELLMDTFNCANQRVWKKTLTSEQKSYAIIDTDGTIQETYGECKEGMGYSYNGKWGFAPLVITEATTGTHLYVVNRSGNSPSQDDAGYWIDKSINIVKDYFVDVYLRGDTAFSLTEKFDDWDDDGYFFSFGYDCHENLVKIADFLPDYKWQRLKRKKSKPVRKRKNNVKKEYIIEKGYKNLTLEKEYFAEFQYKPTNCAKEYRMIVLKKIIKATKGQDYLFDEVRYFFYITNIEHMSGKEIIYFINGRCNHENKIQQFKGRNGIYAMKMPASEFFANWAYMAIGSLAWNLKSWIGLFMPKKNFSEKIIRMEFKKFQNYLINIPCQIISSGRYIVYRFLNYNHWVEEIYKTFLKIKRLKFLY